ncbi:NmrA family NAD(P)-binding protein [Actinoplanes sp. NBRC 103695]|uniref:NmrA family NAD(P)-binding protein n=1 Tax=Actinoplanes sp. NBRC 103695 TaxID=3032202 RepID=UPI0024A2ED3C|nr:NmrA family NAD(P)-binding protein [Actinoplanes sp. NBRC 103695]GLZ02439.1 nucleotide-diphosphate-sugar epimerase [Actinoplanes sp. NBRC 103695]
MTDKKIIAVLGATGKQGGAVARAILDDPEGGFTVRALTRTPASVSADAFPEIVAADLEDEESITRAFAGAYGAFVVTNTWAPQTPEDAAVRSRAKREMDQYAVAARAARAAGVRHVVSSTLEDTRPHFTHLGIDVPSSEDGFTVPHFDAKAMSNRYFTDLGVPTTFLDTASFYDNFLRAGAGPVRDEHGKLVLRLAFGDSTAALVSARDIGRTAYAILKAGHRFVGRTVGLAGDHVTGVQMARMFSDVLGEEVTYQAVPLEALRTSAHPEAATMFQFYTQAAEAFLAHRDLGRLRQLNPALQSLPEWITEHREEFRRAVAPT